MKKSAKEELLCAYGCLALILFLCTYLGGDHSIFVVSFIGTNPQAYEIHLCLHILETSIYLLYLFEIEGGRDK